MANQLEKTANKVNIKYRKSRKALILNVPTPIIPTSKGLIPKRSTVDYVGLLEGGQYIAFDAKETNVTTRFDLSNIHGHQLEFLEFVKDLGGVAFFMIHFKKLHDDQVYLTPLSAVQKYWYDEDARQSIPIKDFKDE